MVGRYDSKDDHWTVDSKTVTELYGKLAVARRAEKRTINSSNSVGRLLDAAFETELGGAESSIERRALRRACLLAARIFAVFKA